MSFWLKFQEQPSPVLDMFSAVHIVKTPQSEPLFCCGIQNVGKNGDKKISEKFQKLNKIKTFRKF